MHGVFGMNMSRSYATYENIKVTACVKVKAYYVHCSVIYPPKHVYFLTKLPAIPCCTLLNHNAIMGEKSVNRDKGAAASSLTRLQQQ